MTTLKGFTPVVKLRPKTVRSATF